MVLTCECIRLHNQAHELPKNAPSMLNAIVPRLVKLRIIVIELAAL